MLRVLDDLMQKSPYFRTKESQKVNNLGNKTNKKPVNLKSYNLFSLNKIYSDFKVFINFKTWAFNSFKGEKETMRFCDYTGEGCGPKFHESPEGLVRRPAVSVTEPTIECLKR